MQFPDSAPVFLCDLCGTSLRTLRSKALSRKVREGIGRTPRNPHPHYPRALRARYSNL